jgi:diguanylate cyclase
MKRNRIPLAHVVLLSIIGGLMMLSLLFNDENLKIPTSTVSNLNDNWTIEVEGQQEVITSLPIKVDAKSNQTVSASTELSTDFRTAQSLLVRSSLQHLVIYLDGNEVYSNNLSNTHQVPIASMWNVVELPEMSHGKMLTIKLESPYLDMAGTINPILYGGKGDLIIYLFNTYGLQLLISIIVLIMGLAMMVLRLIFNPNESKGSELIGLFAVLSSLWLLAESRMLQFIVGSQFLIGSLAYIMLALLISPLVLYIKRYIAKRFHLVYTVLIIIMMINFCYILLAQFTGLKDFFETVFTTNMMIIIASVVSLSLLLFEIIKYKNKDALKLFKLLMVLMVAGLLEFINFVFGNFHNTSLYILIGLVIFMSIKIVSYLRVIHHVINQSKLAQQYQILALQDQLTGSKNRMAFENDIEQLLMSNRYDLVRVVFFDLNNLKMINDNHGHSVGDQAIMKAYSIILDSFGDLGSCYRVGGDEFACLFENTDNDIYRQRIEFFKSKIREANKELLYPFSMAYGSAVYDALQDQYFSDTMSRADHDMYQTKQKQKTSR